MSTPIKISRFQLLVAFGFLIVLALVLSSLISRKPPVPDFSSYAAGDERKTAFVDYFFPLITEANQAIDEDRLELLGLKEENDNDKLGWWDKRQLKQLAEKYGLEKIDPDDKAAWKELVSRVDIIPPSMAIAQAAKESAWGTSRFAREANNFFGQWCFEQGCGLVPANRAAGKSHEVKSFESAEASVLSYLNNLNTHKAYKTLRNIRAQLRATDQPITGLKLIQGLGSYSERGGVYVNELDSMIRYNQFQKLDKPA